MLNRLIIAFLFLALPALCAAKDIGYTIECLTQAQNAPNDTARAVCLNSAVQDMQESLLFKMSRSKQEQKAHALALIQSAVSDLQSHDSAKMNADIAEALRIDRELLAGMSSGSAKEKSSDSHAMPISGNQDVVAPSAQANSATSADIPAGIPDAVRQTILANSAGRKIENVGQIPEDGEITYDIQMTTPDGNEWDLTVGDDGTLLSIDTTLADIPQPVQAAIHAQMGAGTLDEVEKLFDGLDITYRAGITSSNDIQRDYTYNADGTVSSVEANLNELSPAAQATIQTEIGAGKLDSIDRTLEDRKVSYEVSSTTAGGDEHEFSVSEKGDVLSRQISLKDVPAPVQSTISQTIGPGKILEVDQSLSDPNHPYSVRGRKDGKPFYFSVSPAGAFLGQEDEGN